MKNYELIITLSVQGEDRDSVWDDYGWVLELLDKEDVDYNISTYCLGQTENRKI